MSMAALEIIQRSCRAVGMSVPTTAYANPAEDVQQLVELLNQEGRDLARRADWQAMTFQGTFTTVATESQGTLTSIIGATQELRKIVNETIWDRSSQQPIYGPLSKRNRQASLALTLTGPFPRFFIRENTLRMNPVPAAGHACYFEYVSTMWCTNAAGSAYQRNIAADTDLMLLPDEVMCLGLEWRWLRKKGLSYAEEFASYEARVAELLNTDGMKPDIAMDMATDSMRRGLLVPQGSWPL